MIVSWIFDGLDSEVLLNMKPAGMVFLGKELNKDVVFAVFVSCFSDFEQGNQETGSSFADTSLPLGAELKDVSVLVCVAGTEVNSEDGLSVLCVLGSDDRPKNDLDTLASVVSANTESLAG